MTTASASYTGSASLDIYFRDLQRHPLLTAEEERELGRAAQAGDEAARERLVTSNLRFVVTVAKRYQASGLPLEDLISEGNRGLIRAAEKFDPERGTRFLSYAVQWITAKIDHAVQHAPVVRRKGTAPEQTRVIRRAAARLSQRLGATPTTAEIAHAYAMEEATVAEALNVHHALSLDMTFEDSAGSWIDRLENEDEVLPDESAYDAERHETIAAVLRKLPKREAMLLRLLFGLDEPALTRGQIAERFGVSRQRIQQLESQALKRLREDSCAIHLLPFHDPLFEEGAGEAPGARMRALRRRRLRLAARRRARPPRPREAVRLAGPARTEPHRSWDPSVALTVHREPGRPYTLRGYVVERVRASSIDDVAGRAGVPAREIRDYLFGVQPSSSSLQRLRVWYEQAVPRADRGIEAEPGARRVPDGEDAPGQSAQPRAQAARLAGWGFVRGHKRDAAQRRTPLGEHRAQRPPDLDPDGAADRLSEIREFARARADRTGGRQLAARIGIPANTFWSFLQGSRPRDPHATKIIDWHETASREEVEPAPDGYRDVPVETLRTFFRDEAERTSIGRTARAAGLGKSNLAVFISNRTHTPHPRTRRLLGVYYLRRQAEIAGRTGMAPPNAAPPGPRAADGPVVGRAPEASSASPSTSELARAAASDPGVDDGSGSAGTLRAGAHTPALRQRAAAAGPRRVVAELVPEPAADDELRRSYLGVALRTSAATVAAAVNVHLPELMAFLQGGDATHALRAALQADYSHRALIKARALDALIEDVEPAAADSTRRRVLLAIARGMRLGGHHCPGWLHGMLDAAAARSPTG